MSLFSNKDRPSPIHFIAGGLSGALTGSILQPLDVLKTHQQGAFTSVGKLHPSTNFFIPTYKYIIKTSGIKGLWRGTTATVGRVCIGAGMYFVSLNYLLGKSNGSLSSKTDSFFAGAIARTSVGIILSPLTIIKTRMEWADPGSYQGVSHAMRSIVHKEGTRGLFRGLLPTLLRDAPFSGLYVMCYSQLRHDLYQAFPTANCTIIHFGSGVTAGLIATALTHPADVVKTRMQLPTVHGESSPMNPKRLGLLQTSFRIFQEEGVRGYLRGILPRMIKRALSTSLTWTFYEELAAIVGNSIS